MNALPEGRTECGICGYPVNGENPPLYLPVKTVLSDRYLVGRVIKNTGDAAVYMGFDQVQKTRILIREFLPDTLCERAENLEIRIISGCEKTFQDYYANFCDHARALARMRDLPAVIVLYDIFKQNGTTYTVSEYCEGLTLEARLAQLGGRMRWQDARPLFMPLMGSLISLHAAGIYHLGIHPENLIIGLDGKLRLTDFCIAEARMVSTDLKPQLIEGYSAPEQYQFDAPCGEAADVYALAATIFRTLTGNPPPPASSRSKTSNDLFVPADVARDLPDHVAAALFNALQVSTEKRTGSIAVFRDKIAAAPAVTELLKDEKPVLVVEDEEEDVLSPKREKYPPKKKSSRGKIAFLIVVAVFILLSLLAFGVIMVLFPDILKKDNGSSFVPNSAPSLDISLPESTPSSYVPKYDTYAVDNLVGKNYYDIQDQKFNGRMKVELEYLQYSERPEGEIVSQTPAAESLAEEGTTIKVVISAGNGMVKVPNVSGWEQDKAKALLEAYGFRVDTITVMVSDYPKGYVQDTTPEAGQERQKGDVIQMRVSAVEPPASSDPSSVPPTPDPGSSTPAPPNSTDPAVQ